MPHWCHKDGSIKIDLRGLSSDVDGDCLTITVGNTAKGKLTKNSDGTYTYKPNNGYVGLDSFSYTVSDGKLSSTGTISLNVGQAANNGGGGCNSGMLSSATVVVNSSATASSSSNTASSNQIQYVVINSGASNASSSASASNSNAPVAINWQATTSNSSSTSSSSATSTSNWLAQLLKNADDESERLAHSTGLRVKL